MSKPERADFSPSGQDPFPQIGFRDRLMLRRLNRTALRLPETFDEQGKNGRLRVHGMSSDEETAIELIEHLPEEDDTLLCTNIWLKRGLGSSALIDVKASQYVNDELSDLMGIEPRCDTFALGDEQSTLSLFKVMRSATLARQTVEHAATLSYLSTAVTIARESESGFLKTF
jgi:hypothetical protein